MSPRIARLERDYEEQGKPAIDRFWGDISQSGAPLIELSQRSGHSLVTFLWKADVPVRHVVIISELMLGWWWNGYADSRLIQLVDSNVYYRTFLVPDNLCCLYTLAPDMPLIHPADVNDDMGSLLANVVVDPLNPNTESDWMQRSVLRLPDAPTDSWARQQLGVRAGRVIDCPQHFHGLSASQQAKIYLPNETYGGGRIERLLVQFDVETSIRDLRVPVIADNLIADGRIPPTAIVFLDPSDDRGTALNCSTSNAQAIAQEVVPWARATYGLPDAPHLTVVSGGSMALFTGFSHSDVFGVVIGQSCGFEYGPEHAIGSDWDDALADDIGAGWLAAQIVAKHGVAIRIALDVGLLERKRDGVILHALAAHRQMRSVLQAKGYELRYHEYCGGHQFINWRAALPGSLEWALA